MNQNNILAQFEEYKYITFTINHLNPGIEVTLSKRVLVDEVVMVQIILLI